MSSNIIENVQRRKVILDTDVGIDDVESMVFLTACNDIDLLAITLVAGNSCMPVISENARRILSFLNRENIPLYESGSYNLMGEYIESDGYFGDNAFAGIELPTTTLKSQKMTAPEALLHYIKKYPHEIHLIFIGPLTNLAIAFLLDNNLPSLIASITIMGTDTAERTVRCVTDYSEFNLHCDPTAMRLINNTFQSMKTPIIVFDCTFCQNNLLNKSVIPFLKENHNEKMKHAELMTIVRNFENPIINQNCFDDLYFTCDLFAVCAWHDPSVVKSKKRMKLVSVEVENEKRGHTKYEDHPDGLFDVVFECDLKKMEKNIVTVLMNAV